MAPTPLANGEVKYDTAAGMAGGAYMAPTPLANGEAMYDTAASGCPGSEQQPVPHHYEYADAASVLAAHAVGGSAGPTYGFAAASVARPQLHANRRATQQQRARPASSDSSAATHDVASNGVDSILCDVANGDGTEYLEVLGGGGSESDAAVGHESQRQVEVMYDNIVGDSAEYC